MWNEHQNSMAGAENSGIRYRNDRQSRLHNGLGRQVDGVAAVSASLIIPFMYGLLVASITPSWPKRIALVLLPPLYAIVARAGY